MSKHRRIFEPAVNSDILRHEGVPVEQTAGCGVEYQVLNLPTSSCRDVMPVGSSATDTGAMQVATEHHQVHGEAASLWFLRSAGRNGDEIHAGVGSGRDQQLTYRIIPVFVETREQ